jgi:hypothetical protein
MRHLDFKLRKRGKNNNFCKDRPTKGKEDNNKCWINNEKKDSTKKRLEEKRYSLNKMEEEKGKELEN